MDFDFTKWTNEKAIEFSEYVRSLGDESKVAFATKIIKTESPICGLTTPIVRDLMKKIEKTDVVSYLEAVFDTGVISAFYEMNTVSGLVCAHIKDFDLKLHYLEKFIATINNWASCDGCIADFSLKEQDRPKLDKFIDKLAAAEGEFYRRSAIIYLLKFYVGEKDVLGAMELCKSIRSGEYYVNMGAAWFYAECLIKQYDIAFGFLRDNELPFDILKKAAQKARDSYRLSAEQKIAVTELVNSKKIK